MVDNGGYNMYQLSFSIFKISNKYALATNVSAYVKYVNTFACQNYLCKTVVLCISISGRWTQICGAQLSYVNCSDTQMFDIFYICRNIYGQCIFI
jgi:hypothetical protein